MAFTFRDARVLTVSGMLTVVTAERYLYASDIFSNYKTSKLVSMDSYTPRKAVPDYISGTVLERNIPIVRKVYLHRSDTGELVGSTTSDGVDGSFQATTTYEGAHYVVCLDNILGDDYNDLIYGNIYPVTISG